MFSYLIISIGRQDNNINEIYGNKKVYIEKISLFINDIYTACIKTAINEDKIILLTKVFLLNSPKSTEKAAKAHINNTKKGALSLL